MNIMNYTNTILNYNLHSIRVINTFRVENLKTKKEKPMKKIFLITTLAAVLTSQLARAEENNLVVENIVTDVESTIECSNTEGVSLKIIPFLARMPMKKIIYSDLESQIEEDTYFGTESSSLYSQLIFSKLNNFGPNAKLTVTESTFIGRGGCGRGSCDQNVIHQIYAQLVKDEKEIFLNCN